MVVVRTYSVRGIQPPRPVGVVTGKMATVRISRFQIA
jgi:hypothetical protein